MAMICPLTMCLSTKDGPQQRKFTREGGEKNLFLIIVYVFGHPKGVGVLTSSGGRLYACNLSE
jgi:hypothetical protein